MKGLDRFAILSLVLAAASSPGCEGGAGSAPSAVADVTVFAAASTRDVMEEAAARFEAKTGIRPVLSFAASSTLARQIQAGSPADIFVSADEAWMDVLQAYGAILGGTRSDLLANRLVMIAPVQREFHVEPVESFDFAAVLPEIERIAVADPGHVPAGRYAKEALESLGWWQALEPRLIPAQDVRAALRLVEIGEVDAGIVYATDAVHSDRVTVICTLPERLHTPVRYPVAQCVDDEAAAAFIEFLRSPEMIEVFESAGFIVLEGQSSGSGSP